MTRQENFIHQHKKFHRDIALAQIGLFLFLLVLWEAAARLGWIDSFFFSSLQSALFLIQVPHQEPSSN